MRSLPTPTNLNILYKYIQSTGTKNLTFNLDKLNHEIRLVLIRTSLVFSYNLEQLGLPSNLYGASVVFLEYILKHYMFL